ncbi:dipeptidase [Pseudemcibacter aquimaris]|uniref:dipeptidase n=1 Tax=Pseudemcibacter aquimaris TaxID=2857064 RepID=UPI002012983A|nr:dipeptidase [Pseudemcibacter aquimaris]MCC3859898.1 dipeptidase [Pseudemcibacter aquimaris]WDU57230.1 dipeptidase [Pseudemcibacter aquimaris]
MKPIKFILPLLLIGCGTDAHKDMSAEAVHERIFTIDTHVDIQEDMMTNPALDPGTLTDQQVDLVKMEQGGLDGVFFSIYTSQTERTAENYLEAKRIAKLRFDSIHWMAEKYADRIAIAYTPEQAREIYASGKKVAMMGIENGFAIGQDISLIEEYYNRGARYMSLTHNGHNDLCDSAQPLAKNGDGETEHGGLTDLGRAAIDEMNRLGMMVDVSHTSHDCMMQSVKHSKVPPIASHSAVYALSGHVRNLTNEQMLALRDAGGVMQVVAFNQFLKFDPTYKTSQAIALQKVADAHGDPEFIYNKHFGTPEFEEIYGEHLSRFPRANVNDLVDHIDYAVRLMGIDQVAISSDFDGGGGIDGWDNASQSVNVTKELLNRGYTEEEIEKLWSANTLALWERVNEASAKLRN